MTCLISSSTEGDIGGETTVREEQRSGKCLGTQRREGGPRWERDRGRDEGSLKALILKGDSGGKG